MNSITIVLNFADPAIILEAASDKSSIDKIQDHLRIQLIRLLTGDSVTEHNREVDRGNVLRDPTRALGMVRTMIRGHDQRDLK